MDAFASLGPETSGSRLAEQDSIQNFVRMAQGRAIQAQTEQEQFKTSQAKQAAEAMSQLTTPDGMAGPGAGGSLSDIPIWQATQMAKKGFPVQAATMFREAAQIQQMESAARENNSQVLNYQALATGHVLDTAAEFSRTIKSADDWQAAGFMMARLYPNSPNPFAGPYNPTSLGQIQAGALKEKDRLKLQLDQANLSAENAVRAARIQSLRGMLTLREEEVNVAKRREDRLEKEGGKTVARPGRLETDAAEALVRQELPDISSETAELISSGIADETEQLIAKTPGLDRDQARRRILQRHLENGDIQVERSLLNEVSKGVLGKPTYTYRPLPEGAGAAPDKPIPIQDGMKFVPGQYYTKSGRTAKYLPDGTWELVGGK